MVSCLLIAGSAPAARSTARLPAAFPPEAPFQAPGHRLERLGQDELVHLGRVVRDVPAGAGADLEHAAVRVAQEPPAPFGQADPLADRDERVVEDGEDLRGHPHRSRVDGGPPYPPA